MKSNLVTSLGMPIISEEYADNFSELTKAEKEMLFILAKEDLYLSNQNLEKFLEDFKKVIPVLKSPKLYEDIAAGVYYSILNHVEDVPFVSQENCDDFTNDLIQNSKNKDDGENKIVKVIAGKFFQDIAYKIINENRYLYDKMIFTPAKKEFGDEKDVSFHAVGGILVYELIRREYWINSGDERIPKGVMLN
jgi:hypothetical protein